MKALKITDPEKPHLLLWKGQAQKPCLFSWTWQAQKPRLLSWNGQAQKPHLLSWNRQATVTPPFLKWTDMQATPLFMKLTCTKATPPFMKLTGAKATPLLLEMTGTKATPLHLKPQTKAMPSFVKLTGKSHASFLETDRQKPHLFLIMDRHKSHASFPETDRQKSRLLSWNEQVQKSCLFYLYQLTSACLCLFLRKSIKLTKLKWLWLLQERRMKSLFIPTLPRLSVSHFSLPLCRPLRVIKANWSRTSTSTHTAPPGPSPQKEEGVCVGGDLGMFHGRVSSFLDFSHLFSRLSSLAPVLSLSIITSTHKCCESHNDEANAGHSLCLHTHPGCQDEFYWTNITLIFSLLCNI